MHRLYASIRLFVSLARNSYCMALKFYPTGIIILKSTFSIEFRVHRACVVYFIMRQHYVAFVNVCVCVLLRLHVLHIISRVRLLVHMILYISLCINILLWLSYHTEPICVYVRICYVIYIYYCDGITLAYLSCFVIMYELIRDKMFLCECTQANIWIMSRRRRIRRYFAREHMKSYTLIKFASKPKLIELVIATAPAVLFLCLNISKRYSNIHNEYDYWLL